MGQSEIDTLHEEMREEIRRDKRLEKAIDKMFLLIAFSIVAYMLWYISSFVI